MMRRMEMLGKHWAIVCSRVSSAHPFISLTHEKAKPTHRPNSNRLHPQVLAHMRVRIRTHGAWAPSGSMAVERWVGVGGPGREETERKRNWGKGEGHQDLHLNPWPPPATRSALHRAEAPGSERDARPRSGRGAGLVRGARARAPSRAPSQARDPGCRGSEQRGSAAPAAPPPRTAGRAAGLSRQTRESEAEADTWGTFPPRLEFHRKHMRRRSRHGRGRGGNFPLRLTGFGPRSHRSGEAEGPRATPQGPAPGPRGEPERGGEGGSSRWSPGRAAGPALPWWFSSGMYILVFSLTIDQKSFLKGEAATKRKKCQNTPRRVWINPSS